VAEQRGFGAALGNIDQRLGAEVEFIEGAAVAAQRRVGFRAARDVAEDRPGKMAPGGLFQILQRQDFAQPPWQRRVDLWFCKAFEFLRRDGAGALDIRPDDRPGLIPPGTVCVMGGKAGNST
jgi:hypothetical protein